MGPMAGGLCAALVLSWIAVVASAPFNITTMLMTRPRFSQFNQLMSSSGVAVEVNSRTSVTVLVVPNNVLGPFLTASPTADAGQIADLLRYHCLLQYLDIPELKQIVPGSPSTVTTLLQTTGRVKGDEGVVNINNDGTTIGVGLPDPTAPSNATIVAGVTQIPYNISILELSDVLVPPGFLDRSDNANITAALEAALNYKTFIQLITTTGIDLEYASKQTGTGITIFAPTDAAFSALPAGALAGLTPAQVNQVLRIHALLMYYPLGTLSTLNKPDEPTLATTVGGPRTYLLNVSSLTTGGVELSTGASTATVGATIFDSTPTSIFSVNNVLLPKEIFAAAPTPAPGPTPGLAPEPTTPVPAPVPTTPGSAPAPAPVTPVPAPVPTPSSTPAPAPEGPTPTPGPSPSMAPGPPAPPEESPVGEGPAPSILPRNAASVTVMSRVMFAAVLFFSVLMSL